MILPLQSSLEICSARETIVRIVARTGFASRVAAVVPLQNERIIAVSADIRVGK